MRQSLIYGLVIHESYINLRLPVPDYWLNMSPCILVQLYCKVLSLFSFGLKIVRSMSSFTMHMLLFQEAITRQILLVLHLLTSKERANPLCCMWYQHIIQVSDNLIFRCIQY